MTCFPVQGTVVLCRLVYVFLYMKQLCDMFPCSGNGCLMFFLVNGTVVLHVSLCRERLYMFFPVYGTVV